MTDAGAILVRDKPPGVTSASLVYATRRELGVKRVGHAGTLDPFATGMLLIMVGRCTRLQRYVLGLPKTYRATARLGWRSTTGDPDGELTRTGVIPSSLQLPIGTIDQRVPLTSAVKVDGERLYRKAHRGETDAERPIRQVEIIRAELLESDGETATFEIECSSGTYVRTLIETLGDAYCCELRRTAIGPLQMAPGERRLTAAEALAFLPRQQLADGEREDVSNGRSIALGVPVEPATAVLLCAGEEAIGVGRCEQGAIKPEVVLVPAGQP